MTLLCWLMLFLNLLTNGKVTMTFDLFWSQYPRKQAKAVARKAWARLTAEQIEKCLAVIDQHCRYWRALGTEPQYIPMCSTWINQERFDDELQMPTLEKVVAWWATDNGVLKKGQELGISPRPGEEMKQFKERVVGQFKRSA